MDDPHVNELHYRIKHAPSVSFGAATLDHSETNFAVHIENDAAIVTMLNHYNTVEAARAEVEPYLKAWELSSTLADHTDRFEFSYQKASIINLNPTPGSSSNNVSILIVGESHLSVDMNTLRSSYPAPPTGLAGDAYVDLMVHRYRMYRENRTTLADASNLCLTALELAATAASSHRSGARKAAAKHFGIADAVLDKLGELSGTKGG